MQTSRAQQQAIEHFKGPALVIAGPGSGKTTVITHRIRNLIEEHGVSPSEILVITFTKMAAHEMKQRFLRLTQEKYGGVSFGTFHAVFFKILKHTYNYGADCIIKQSEQIELVKQVASQTGMTLRDEEEFAGSIISQISTVKSEKLDLDEYIPKECSKDFFRKVYYEYDNYLKKMQLIDFDDMIMRCFELLRNNEKVLLMWQNKYRYILIDEFQDICNMQFKVIKLIAKKNQNIFIVGDDDQSIYGFRGANPEIMLDFKRVYPGAVQINLNTNYRSDANIVYAAKSLIENNKKRFDKEIEAFNEARNKVVVKEFDDIESECNFVVDIIQKSLEHSNTTKAQSVTAGYDDTIKIKYSDFGILTRTNTGTSHIIRKLVESNIPFKTTEKVDNIFNHWISKDIISYMRIISGSHDRKDFLRIINKPVRYIKRESMKKQRVDFNDILDYYSGHTQMIRRVENLMHDIELMQKMNTFAAINYLRKGIGYDEYLKGYAKEHNVKEEELFETLECIHEITKKYNEPSCWLEFIDDYSEKILQNSKEKVDNECTENAVNICTLHASKGLEYKIVFILDVNEGNIPYSKATMEWEIEEERRMFYVALTRAKESLYILYAKKGMNKPMEKSSFIEEIDKKYVGYM